MSIEQGLHCKVIGQGPALVLVHGWGVNSTVWQPIVSTLEQHFTLYLIDLPGFGHSAPLEEYSLQSISEAILQVVPSSATWCGWSLGGVIATYAAIHYPQRVSKLIQVASSIKFVADGDWPGVEADVFDNFQLGLQKNASKTLSRFIALQAMGCASARQDGATLKKLLADTPPAQQAALQANLQLLSDSDLRSEFTGLQQPCLALLGKFDGLVPSQASEHVAALVEHCQVYLFEHSAHAPFISESELFCSKIVAFMEH